MKRSDASIWKEYAAVQAMYERKAAVVFNTALRRQVAVAIGYIDQYGYETLASVLPAIIRTQPIEIAMRRVYEYTCVNAAGREYSRLRREEPIKAVPWESFRSVWKSFFNQWISTNLGKRIVDITDTTRERITKVITDNQTEGSRDIAKKIVDTLKSPEFTRKRAVVIARTETTTAGNLGHETGARSWANELGILLYKKWIATNDSRTRDIHRTMLNAPPIPADLKFSVGGEPMQNPGDQQASARNVCNCRCRSFYMSDRKAASDYGISI